MRYVAIIKTVGDFGKDISELHKGLPADYPVACKEYETEQEAKAAHPGCKIMDAAHYRGYADGMNMLYKHVKESGTKKWWQW